VIFQRDYWKMEDRDLERLASKYRIETSIERSQGGIHWLVEDRDRIITTLINRDTALRTNWAIIMSLVSLGLSIISLIKR
jgi:hypothetical protein